MTRRVGAALFACAALLVGGAAAVATSSCSQTPVNVPVRTFERAQKMDVVCLKVLDSYAGQLIQPVPVPQATCAPVATGEDATALQFRLYALVTQTTRGEIAVVDLTTGIVVDTDKSTPGINFLPVGQLPTDVAVAPDGLLSFVAAAEVNKPAIYALDNTKILGDSLGLKDKGPVVIPNLATWPVCSLPQPPGAMAIVPFVAPTPGTPTGDAGTDAESDAAGDAAGDAATEAGDAEVDAASDAGIDAASDAGADAAGAGGASEGPKYKIVVVLPGRPTDDPVHPDTHNPEVWVLDPADFTSRYTPGALLPCVPVGKMSLRSFQAAGNVVPGPAWDDGLHYDAGVASDAAPPLGAQCSAALADAGGGAVDSGSATDAAGAGDGAATTDDGGSPGAPTKPHASAAALDVSGARLTLYVADDADPVIHVVDVTDPLKPAELEPLRATSLVDPTRSVQVGSLAVSPTTHDYKRYLYALDKREGSIIVYDITDPVTSPKLPLTRPHAELNPFQPVDRIIFNVPVAALSFVHHDFPLTDNFVAKGGVLCNPNRNASGGDGARYRATEDGNQPIGLGPSRLRGVFAFVTLSNGTIVTIDVDDWDGPCRRPDPMADYLGSVEDFINDGGVPLTPEFGQTWGWTSAIAPPQPLAAPGDLDPYHAPFAEPDSGGASPVTDEAFFPVSAPHRPRSQYLLRNNPTTGLHMPGLSSQPQLFKQTAPLPTDSKNGLANPILLPTWTTLADPSYVKDPSEPDPLKRTLITDPLNKNKALAPRDPGVSLPGAGADVRIAYEDPQVHIDQDWAISYEGVLPGFGTGIAAEIEQNASFQTLTFRAPEPSFCRKGIEDFDLGKQRAQAAAKEITARQIPVPAGMERWVTDYVQLTDDILPPDDPYWREDLTKLGSCWEQVAFERNDLASRQASCASTFGATLDPANQALQRDFPILEAYDDHLVIGSYDYEGGIVTTQTRRVAAASSKVALARLQCCFHNQAHFNVRTGGEWVANAAASGYMHHIVAAAGGRCQPSCDPRLALMNARTVGVPRPVPNAPVLPIYRDSPLALRNPMFATILWNGAGAIPDRDMVWRFSTRGQYSPLIISIAATSSSVSPQSMRFIDSLGQLAVVDGASQGLILIDLNILGFAHTPYF